MVVHWGLARIDDETIVVGSGGFYRGFPDGVGEIGYVLLPAYRGSGYATEAVRAITRFGFDVLGLRQITAFTDQANAASAAVLRRADFREVPVAQDPASRQFLRYRL
ncbi:MAG: GNAT family N-acetyltransferase [Hymenobacteraceae bacterium]|nr:GNAT family N-acetyltransferase [Hymenobacteraceae bacterium]